MPVVELVVAVLVGYLVGTIPFAVIVTRLATRGHGDIRAMGSGNPGGFNTFREVGKVWGAVVILLDGAKAMAAGVLALVAFGDAAAYTAATAVIAGHIWPVWNGGRGGKGVAAAGGAVLGVFPAYFPLHLAVLALGALGFRNSRRAMLTAAITWVVASIVWTVFDWPNAWGPEPSGGLVAFSILGAAMVTIRFVVGARPTPAAV